MQHITIFYGFNIDLSKFEKYQGQDIYLTMVDLDTEYKDASGQMQDLTVSEMILNFDADIVEDIIFRLEDKIEHYQSLIA